MGIYATLAPLLQPTGLTGINLLYASTLAALATHWLCRVARESRKKRALSVGWIAVPALLMLLLARSTEIPALFGIGLTLLLLSEYWPRSYVTRQRRPAVTGPLLGLLLGLILSGILAVSEFSVLILVAALGCWLSGTAGMLAYALWPRRQAIPLPQGVALRMQRVKVPDWPEFSLTLTEQGAQLTNTSPQPLKVVGWSPRSINGWLPALNTDGYKVETLESGQSAFLPLTAFESGLRVWYTESEATQLEPRLFKADWVPPSQNSRTLN